MTNEEESSQDFRRFAILLCIEAVVATAILAPSNPGTPWWIWGLVMLFTPVGWIIPGIVLWLLGMSTAADPKQQTPPRASVAYGSSSGYSRLSSDWELALRLQGLDLSAFYSNIEDIYEEGADRVRPGRVNVFRAFHLTPIDSIEVVLLGQDPYATGHMADGLAFSQQGTPLPNSALHRILMNLTEDPAIGARNPTSGDLESWARQGVLLLNRALTVEVEKPGSHLFRWTTVSRMVLRAILERRPDAVYICFGRPAIEAVRAVNPYSRRENIVSTAHPMARDLEDSELRRFQGSRPFSEANELLRARGRAPIDWSLA